MTLPQVPAVPLYKSREKEGKKKARKRRQRLIPPFHGSQPVCLRMIRKPPVLDPAHPGDGNYLPGRCSLSRALIFFFSARMSRIFFCLSPDTANTKLQLSSFVFPLSRAEAAALPLPPPPAALGSAGPRSRPYPGRAAPGGGQVMLFRLKTQRMLGDRAHGSVLGFKLAIYITKQAGK